MITGDKRETLERWLFNFTEPPYEESYETLAEQYKNNLIELTQAETESEWEIEDLVCTPDEIREVVEARVEWLQQKEYKHLIGKHLSEVPDVMYDRWPEVDHDGIITAILDGDCIPEDAVLIDGFNDEGEPIIVDGTAGFMAVLRV